MASIRLFNSGLIERQKVLQPSDPLIECHNQVAFQPGPERAEAKGNTSNSLRLTTATELLRRQQPRDDEPTDNAQPQKSGVLNGNTPDTAEEGNGGDVIKKQ